MLLNVFIHITFLIDVDPACVYELEMQIHMSKDTQEKICIRGYGWHLKEEI